MKKTLNSIFSELLQPNCVFQERGYFRLFASGVLFCQIGISVGVRGGKKQSGVIHDLENGQFWFKSAQLSFCFWFNSLWLPATDLQTTMKDVNSWPTSQTRIQTFLPEHPDWKKAAQTNFWSLSCLEGPNLHSISIVFIFLPVLNKST